VCRWSNIDDQVALDCTICHVPDSTTGLLRFAEQPLVCVDYAKLHTDHLMQMMYKWDIYLCLLKRNSCPSIYQQTGPGHVLAQIGSEKHDWLCYIVWLA
jgi:hypothetical protein